ncbi:mitochondrial 54S ribosomal protein YmL35 [Elasticomyces elasticus]|uniref:Large ribosomal subunit protein mL38 n=1 Tax=Elasticomyces elasticus TaxID=574655 RepID=A0AAN7W7P5_9PEZI|nr:mitochondrial 54S ribosomal protein YmL35 [Elasticomyces elasticus]
MSLKRPITQCLQLRPHRCLSTEVATPSASPPPPPSTRQRNPLTVATANAEHQLLAQSRRTPIGSRRRRAAINSTSQIPFPLLPYQCFQEARSFLQEDRQQKLEEIRVQRERIERLREKVVVGSSGNDGSEGKLRREKEGKLRDMARRLEELKVNADINDPVIKKRFEDGQGDMSKPIYLHLAHLRWSSTTLPLLNQRLTQMNVIPDVLPSLTPTVSTEMAFPVSTSTRLKRVAHGDILLSELSERAPTMWIQPFDRGERLVTVVVVNPDVPDVEKDGFGHRCHYLAVNIPVSPTDTKVKLGDLEAGKGDVVLDWLPAFAQQGLPYQRMAVFVLEQSSPVAKGEPLPVLYGEAERTRVLDVEQVRMNPRHSVREGFNLRSLVDRWGLKAVGGDLFRTKWDEGTAGVMQRAGIVGGDVEFKRKRVEPLPYQRQRGSRYR